MKVTFVQPVYENLGIQYLSAVLKRSGHQTEMVYDPRLFNDMKVENAFLARYLQMDDWVLDRIVASHPDIVAFSIMTDIYGWSLRLARRLKKRLDIPMIWGGIHTTSVPEYVLANDCVDYIVVGEGEQAFLEFVESYSRGAVDCSIPNLGYKKNGRLIINPVRPPLENLDELPFPDKELWFEATRPMKRIRYTVMGSRGCPCKCTYCNASFIKTLYKDYPQTFLRYRSVDNLMSELTQAKQRWDIVDIFFNDELMTARRRWFEEFMTRYAEEIALPFYINVHPVNLDDKLISILENANCCTAVLGLQTIREETRKLVLHRKYSNQKFADIIDRFSRSRIFLIINIILNLPDQSLEEMKEIAIFLAEHPGVDFATPFLLRYYPKTEIVEIARQRGLLIDEEIEQLEKTEDYNPFTMVGKKEDLRVLKVRNLILLTPLLPANWILWLARNEHFKYIPNIDLFQLSCRLTAFSRRVFQQKIYVSETFTIPQYLRHILHYLRKKFVYCMLGRI
ncbi:cobalamin-dependent protein [bacterium]|nr:cobalamin-dependent protein [bacterium]